MNCGWYSAGNSAAILPAGGKCNGRLLQNIKTGLDMRACGGIVRRDGLTLTDTMCCTAVVPGKSELTSPAARRSARRALHTKACAGFSVLPAARCSSTSCITRPR